MIQKEGKNGNPGKKRKRKGKKTAANYGSRQKGLYG